MDPFAVIMLGGTLAVIVALLLLGWFYPGSGADQLDWKPTRSAELEVQNEIDDLEQMLEAANARRRKRGRPELTEEGLRADVGRELRESVSRSDDYLAELEVVQMVERKNERRKAKGLEPLDVEAERARILAERPPT